MRADFVANPAPRPPPGLPVGRIKGISVSIAGLKSQTLLAKPGRLVSLNAVRVNRDAPACRPR